ncbi:hypothetical protein [Microvirga ossetica]|uniref:hypothetical protein n=1 Tax=Microvirga ossetica TaxID=1882682 RepID=UPI001F1702E9|nr:hypothetical protein [Microvirga ossetica]
MGAVVGAVVGFFAGRETEFGLGAGPYSDQIYWAPAHQEFPFVGDRNKYGLVKNEHTNNEYVGLTEFSQDNVSWIRMNVYARIGAYHILHEWFLSRDGAVMSRVGSKGVAINMNHSHHPYWRLDFDIDGPENNRVYVVSNDDWLFYSNEVNDTKNMARNKKWVVRNELTRNQAWIFPVSDAGADGFATMDVAVRRYHKSEESTPWPFAKGELGFNDNESVANADIVFWYVGHMYHEVGHHDNSFHFADLKIQVDLESWRVIGASGPLCYYPINHQLEFCRVRRDGRVWLHWKDNNGPWHLPVPLTEAQFARHGGRIVLAFYPINNQLEALTVAENGAVHVLWKANNAPWQGPVQLTQPEFVPGGGITLSYYPLNNQLEALMVDKDGQVNILWKAQNGPWQGPVPFTQSEFPPGGSITSTFYPINNQLEALTIGNDGRVRILWKANNEPWQGPVAISPANFPPGGGITSAFYPINNQLEALTIDKNGQVNVLWKAQNGPWQGPVPLTQPDYPPGGQIALAFYPLNNQFEALTIANDGRVHLLWKANNEPWKGPVAISPPGFPPGGQIASAFYPLNNQLEAVTIGNDEKVYVLWKANNEPWKGPVPIEP